MKTTLISLLVILCLAKMANAQVSKTVNVSAGGLSSALTETEKNTVTNLTITGTIDARDFKIMRDDIPLLEEIDIYESSISAYSGPEGTDLHGSTIAPENAIPPSAFMNLKNGYLNGKTSLNKIILPSNLVAFGESSFWGSGLTSIDIPPSVITIGTTAFAGSSITTLLIPSSVTSIGGYAFRNCSSLSLVIISSSVTYIGAEAFAYTPAIFTVDMNNPMYFSLDGVLLNKDQTSIIQFPTSRTGSYTIPNSVVSIDSWSFGGCNLSSLELPSSVKSIGDCAFWNGYNISTINLPPSLKTIGTSAFWNCKNLTSVIIPPSVTSIDMYAFAFCWKLTSVIVPSSVEYIGSYAFIDCSRLADFTIGSYTPLSLCAIEDLAYSCFIFEGVDKINCKLHVPYGTSDLYQKANEWKDFYNILEMPGGFKVWADSIDFPPQSSTSNLKITSDISWTASSNQGWLKVNPISGIGDKTVSFSADSNLSYIVRTAEVIVSAPNVPSKTISITQKEFPKVADISAGSLVNALSMEEMNRVRYLVISGTIDARDFKTMRDNMPLLTTLDISSASVVSYTGTAGTAGIDKIVYPGNEIPSNAFYNSATSTGKTILKSITLPSSLRSIGNSAFEGCNGLMNIIIPSMVNSIGNNSFSGCINLISMTIPSTVAIIGGKAFLGCKELISIDIPPAVHSIGSSAFSGCSKLSSVIIPDLITSIEDSTFQNCSGLNSINLPSTVTVIGSCAFSGCSGLATLILPSTITSLGIFAFASCSGLISMSIPPLVTEIKEGTFQNCSGLKTVNLPSTITSIGSYAFSGCSSLASLMLPSKITSIGISAFAGCNSLISITIPPLVTEIKEGTFQYCNQLTNVLIPPAVTTIGNFAFSDCSAFTIFTIPTSIITVGNNAFSNCIGLTEIDIPTSVTKIGINAFDGCTKLNNVTIPSSISTIEIGTFYACSGLTNISIPLSVSMIGDFAFARCSGLYAISIPASVTSIGSYAFSDCGLTSLSIPNSISLINYGTFTYCQNLISVSIPSSVTFLAGSTFSFCSALNTIYCYGYGPPFCFVENFDNVNKTTCKLYVPYGTKEAYSKAKGWKDFTNIIEMPGFKLSLASVDFPHQRNTIPINISSDINWTASSDQSWLKVDPLTGIGNIAVNLTAETNEAFSPRTAKITFSATGVNSQIITITQQANFINHAPVANAGQDQTVKQGTTVTLNGSSSSDPDGNTVTFMWSAPTGITLSSATISNPTFIAPNVSGNTDYIFILMVNDGMINSTADQVTITVYNNLAPSVPIFINPVSNEIKDATIPIFFNWDAANDPEHDALSYKLHIWSNLWDTIIDCGVSLYCYLPSDILNGHTNYNCTVTAWDGKTGTASNIISFSTINHPPTVPQLFLPTNNSILDAHAPIDFFWLRTPDIDRDSLTYDLHIIGTAKDTVISNILNYPYSLPSFILSPDGTYRFWITANDGLTESKSPEVTCYTNSYTKIEEVNNKCELVVFPNPSNGLITFIYRNTDNTRLQELDLYNSMGVHVKSLLKGRNDKEINQQFNLQSQPNGLFTLVVKTQSGKYVLKLSLIK